MIIPTMTYEEMVAEYNRDFKQNVEPAYSHYFGKEQQIMRFAKRYTSDKTYYFPVQEYVSKSNNRYLVMFYFYGKAGFRKNGIFSRVFLTYKDREGKIGVMHVGEHGSTFWSQHFFERYRLRALKDTSLSLNEVIHTFMKALKYTEFSPVDHPDYKNCMYGMMDEGLLLCEHIKSADTVIIVARTFISNEMVKEGQYDVYNFINYTSLNDSDNGHRPDYILKYEEKHKDDQLFYGKPIVLPEVNDTLPPEPETIKGDDIVKLGKEVVQDLVYENYFLSDEENRFSKLEKYVKKQRMAGNDYPMCFAPMVARNMKGHPFYISELRVWGNGYGQTLTFTFTEVGGSEYLAAHFRNMSYPFLLIMWDIEILKRYRDANPTLAEWSLIEVVIPFLGLYVCHSYKVEGTDNDMVFKYSFCTAELAEYNESLMVLKIKTT